MLPLPSRSSAAARCLAQAGAAALLAFFFTLPLLHASDTARPSPPAVDTRDRAVVKQDKVAVHEAMRADSEVRSELKKGDVVRVELEVSGGPDGAWSSIADIQGRHLGYVPTAALERDAAPRARWHVVEPSGSRPRAPARGQARRPAGGRGPEQGTEELEPQRSRSAPRGTRASSEVRVQFFAVRWCGWCNKTRVLLRSLGVSVDEYDIEAQPERKAELVARSGQTGVPFLDIEGITMVGYSEAAIRRAVEERRAAE